MPRSENKQMVHVIVVDDHRAFGAEQLDAIGLAQRRIAGRQRVADAEIDYRAVAQRDYAPRHVVRVVAGFLEYAHLAARDDFHRRIAFEEPAHEVDVIREHVQHGRRVRLERLRMEKAWAREL